MVTPDSLMSDFWIVLATVIFNAGILWLSNRRNTTDIDKINNTMNANFKDLGNKIHELALRQVEVKQDIKVIEKIESNTLKLQERQDDIIERIIALEQKRAG